MSLFLYYYPLASRTELPEPSAPGHPELHTTLRFDNFLPRGNWAQARANHTPGLRECFDLERGMEHRRKFVVHFRCRAWVFARLC